MPSNAKPTQTALAVTSPTALVAKPAQSLVEAAQALKQEALPYGSPLYTDLAAARATKELTKLEIFLRNAAAIPHAYAKAAFVGNRGSGKSTFLLHLEHDLFAQNLFTPLHIAIDSSLEADCGYSDLFLWTVHEVAAKFEAHGHPVDAPELEKVARWFAEKSFETSTAWTKQTGLEADAAASAGGGWPGLFSFKLLTRLKSMIVGSETSRATFRKHIQNYANDLVDLVNGFLDHARDILARAGKPVRLLIVQDNLDRLRAAAPITLFDTGGAMLTQLRADIIYTAPIALNLAPFNLRSTFRHVFTMPNAKVRRRDGKSHKDGIDGLLELIGKRLQLDLIFANQRVARYLVENSGGSIRDLIRLLDDVQLIAQVDGKLSVDMASAKEAVRKLSTDITRSLVPSAVYFPILCEVHKTKRDSYVPPGEITPEGVAGARLFFAELVVNGSVLEYNGDDSWYDVHPAICQAEAFRDACRNQP